MKGPANNTVVLQQVVYDKRTIENKKIYEDDFQVCGPGLPWK